MFHRTCTWLILLAAALCLPGGARAETAGATGSTLSLQQAVDGHWRPAANKARDRYRHPVETLQFFGIRPDMTVIELAPGGGWYTEILAPYLAANGHLIEAGASPRFAARLKAEPAIFGHVAGSVPFAPPGQVQLGAAGSADMVLTFRNAHDWLNDSPAALAAAFRAAFAVLKPGGVFGVVEHRARPSADAVQSSKALHRIPEDYLIALALKTGFRLDGVAQINANPRDPEDVNVHRLLPDLAGPDGEHAKMKAIGESDRITLRFVKP
ncbi:MAG TPA: hypothetical protein VFH59_16815 [Frateuria sp.]|uniref:class I SAM-dependent methyltransferase n=1 Tax=Frateuria sp. TaxID=2211372 RepID=UPI002D7F3158|nr:hypothetical protein [Frateuria sp.]HET6807099.1 hypothetical protein [Frateuria sp.]